MCSVEKFETSHSTLGFYLDYVYNISELEAWPCLSRGRLCWDSSWHQPCGLFYKLAPTNPATD